MSESTNATAFASHCPAVSTITSGNATPPAAAAKEPCTRVRWCWNGSKLSEILLWYPVAALRCAAAMCERAVAAFGGVSGTTNFVHFRLCSVARSLGSLLMMYESSLKQCRGMQTGVIRTKFSICCKQSGASCFCAESEVPRLLQNVYMYRLKCFKHERASTGG